jgi:hypothetical protein
MENHGGLQVRERLKERHWTKKTLNISDTHVSGIEKKKGGKRKGGIGEDMEIPDKHASGN